MLSVIVKKKDKKIVILNFISKNKITKTFKKITSILAVSFVLIIIKKNII